MRKNPLRGERLFLPILTSKWAKTAKGFANPLEPRSHYGVGPLPLFYHPLHLCATDQISTVHRKQKHTKCFCDNTTTDYVACCL